MTSDVQQSMEALSTNVLSPTDHAVMGGQMAAAGLSASEISNLIGLIERSALNNAQAAARQTALEIVPVLMRVVQATHTNAAMEIYRQLANKLAGFGGLVAHQNCAQIALNVAQTSPRHVPPPAAPIIGSNR